MPDPKMQCPAKLCATSRSESGKLLTRPGNGHEDGQSRHHATMSLNRGCLGAARAGKVQGSRLSAARPLYGGPRTT